MNTIDEISIDFKKNFSENYFATKLWLIDQYNKMCFIATYGGLLTHIQGHYFQIVLLYTSQHRDTCINTILFIGDTGQLVVFITWKS